MFSLIEEFAIDSNLFKFLLGLLIAAAIFANHHFLDLFSLLDGGLKVPFLRFQLLIFFLDGFYFCCNLFNLLLEVGDSLFTLFSDFFYLFFERFNLIFIYLGILFGESHLHFLLYFEHLNLLDHGVQLVYQIFFFLQI